MHQRLRLMKSKIESILVLKSKLMIGLMYGLREMVMNLLVQQEELITTLSILLMLMLVKLLLQLQVKETTQVQ